jgi:hypothetical protein
MHGDGNAYKATRGPDYESLAALKPGLVRLDISLFRKSAIWDEGGRVTKIKDRLPW